MVLLISGIQYVTVNYTSVRITLLTKELHNRRD